MPSVVVVGSNGMLGKEISALHLSSHEIIEVNRTSRGSYRKNKHIRLGDSISELPKLIDMRDVEYIVNAAGLIRQRFGAVYEDNLRKSIDANVNIPLHLARMSENYGVRVIQIGTDCVFSGKRGSYTETDRHDPNDIYGITKSIGELPYPLLSIIRASIVGLESDTAFSLLSWLLSQERNQKVSGYVDHLWNGITVLQFAKVVSGIIERNNFDKFTGIHHLIPQNTINKYTLLKIFAENFHRADLDISPANSGTPKNLTLSTNNPEICSEIWKTAGYSSAPSIEEMVLEYSQRVLKDGENR